MFLLLWVLLSCLGYAKEPLSLQSSVSHYEVHSGRASTVTTDLSDDDFKETAHKPSPQSLKTTNTLQHPLKANRLLELNKEYAKGAKTGSYSAFVSEMKKSLEQTNDLKEAARLATLIRDYIHGQIIAFDRTKAFTESDRHAVLDAHATVTAFFTLSPFGTDRYREDTLRYVMHDVSGRYAQELTIVADAVQAALWAGKAGTREHVTKEVFLRWMTPAYQKDGAMDVSQALGSWQYNNREEAKDLVATIINQYIYPSDFDLPRSIKIAVSKEQEKLLSFKAGTTINVPGNANQCGFYSTGKPNMRYQEERSGPRLKFTQSFQHAYYDPQLFWMLVAFAKNKNWKESTHPEWEILKQESTLNFEYMLQNDEEVLTYEKKQIKAKIKQLVEEFGIIRKLKPSVTEANVKSSFDAIAKDAEEKRQKNLGPHSSSVHTSSQSLSWETVVMIWSDGDLFENELLTSANLRKIARSMETMVTAFKKCVQKEEGSKYNDFIRNQLNPLLEEGKAYQSAIEIQAEYHPLTARLLQEKVIQNQSLFEIIPFGIKKMIVDAATFLADEILDTGHGQLEINPGTDVDVLDTANTSLDTLVAYLNDRAVNVLCTNAVMANFPYMQLPDNKKVGSYYLGKEILYHGFGKMYTVNYGGDSGGHYQMYVTDNTPKQAIANVLRNPNRHKDSWDLLESAKWHSQNSVPSGNQDMLQAWTQAYDFGAQR